VPFDAPLSLPEYSVHLKQRGCCSEAPPMPLLLPYFVDRALGSDLRPRHTLLIRRNPDRPKRAFVPVSYDRLAASLGTGAGGALRVYYGNERCRGAIDSAARRSEKGDALFR